MKEFLICVSTFFCCSILAQTTYFVKEGGTGSGQSWHDASGELSDILKNAKAGDQIWVAKGIYFPTIGNDRTKSFVIKDGVSVLGGFSGKENNADDRKIENNATILSGAIGEKTNSDNSYSIVQISKASHKTVLDGFIIEDGNADGVGGTGDKVRCGGGLFTDGLFSESVPTIKNCVFRQNMAFDGGAVYNNGRHGEASPTFENCRFENNGARLDGGAVYNDARKNGNSRPVFVSCKFVKNEANYGGAMYNYGGNGICNPTIKKCQITKNKAFIRGGAIMNSEMEENKFEKLEDSRIEGNISESGVNVICFMN